MASIWPTCLPGMLPFYNPLSAAIHQSSCFRRGTVYEVLYGRLHMLLSSLETQTTGPKKQSSKAVWSIFRFAVIHQSNVLHPGTAYASPDGQLHNSLSRCETHAIRPKSLSGRVTFDIVPFAVIRQSMYFRRGTACAVLCGRPHMSPSSLDTQTMGPKKQLGMVTGDIAPSVVIHQGSHLNSGIAYAIPCDRLHTSPSSVGTHAMSSKQMVHSSHGPDTVLSAFLLAAGKIGLRNDVSVFVCMMTSTQTTDPRLVGFVKIVAKQNKQESDMVVSLAHFQSGTSLPVSRCGGASEFQWHKLQNNLTSHPSYPSHPGKLLRYRAGQDSLEIFLSMKDAF